MNFYSPTFILYELSSPFLNIHWFLDKVNMTGSRAQWYNGLMLIFSFFTSRLVWGTWQSAAVYMDMFKALRQTWSSPSSVLEIFQARAATATACADETCLRANTEVYKFSDYAANGVPAWLVFTYVASNLVLNSLNYYWFSKMIDAVMKRFREPAAAKEKREPGEEIKLKEKAPENAVLDAATKLQEQEGSTIAEKVANGQVDLGIADALRRRNVDLGMDVELSIS